MRFRQLFIFALTLPSAAIADTVPRAAHNPKVCSGFVNGESTFVMMADCPPGHAFYSQCCSPGGVSTFADGSRVMVSGVCCPLPAEDILMEDEPSVLAVEECPEGYVATGGTTRDCPDCRYHLRCTRINAARYTLAAAGRGINWGISSSYWKHSKVIARGELPPAVRFGLGRTGLYRFRSSGCIAEKPGALLVGRYSKHCSDHYFRELQFRGAAGDPQLGTAVRMFPECLVPPDPFTQNARCLP